MPEGEKSELKSSSENKFASCVFCGIFEAKVGGGTSEFFQIYPNLSELGQVIEVTNNFVLIPDIAPLTINHLLLVTRSHLPSLASTPESNLEELSKFVGKTVGRMKGFHPDSEIVVFEHGVGTIEGKVVQCGSCGRTDHAHLHILPMPKGKLLELETLAKGIASIHGLRLEKIEPLPNVEFRKISMDYPYLYLSSNKNQHAYLFVQDSLKTEVPSQLIRKLLAVKGFEEKEQIKWDWRDFTIFYPELGEKMIIDTLKHWFANK